VAIDLKLVYSAIEAIDRAKRELAGRTRELTDGSVSSTTLNEVFRLHLFEAFGIDLPDLQMATLEKALASNDMNPAMRELLLIRLQAMFYPSLSLFLGLGALLVLWLGSRDVMQGRLTLGEFVAFNAYLGMLTWPMIAFGWVTNMLQRGTASWKRMLEVMDTVPLVADGPGAAGASPLPPIQGEIEIRDLTFAYNGTPVLRDVSLQLAAGASLAIVGETGQTGFHFVDEAAPPKSLKALATDSVRGFGTRGVVRPEFVDRLLGAVPAGYIAVAESGVTSRADLDAAGAAGASAALVGTALMRNPELLTELTRP
jgi:hypothetical protein